ncbi:MAG TPA: PKD domain-containing protein [Chitinophagales bacterium]|nr:PKD domain-containing protein [Chitinophagales bacterium]
MRKTLLLAFVLGLTTTLFAQEYRLVWPKQDYVFDSTVVNFQWSVVDNATSYELQYSDNDPTFGVASLISASGTSYQTTLTARKTYYWRVRAITNQGTQAWSYARRFYIFEPPQKNGLLLWFEANRNVTAPGGAVSEWVDRSASITATQTAANKPTFTPNVTQLKGKPVVSFAGGTSNPQMMTFPSVTIDYGTNGGYTCLAVRNYNSNPGTYLQYFLGGPSGVEANGFVADASYYTGSTGWGAYTTVGGYNGLYTTIGADLTSTYSIYTVQPEQLTRNGIARPTGTNNEAGSNAKSNFLLGTLGRTATGIGQFFSYKGNLAEVIVYDNTLDTTSRVLAEQYLRYKYANPVNMGPDTIFPSFCVNTTLTPGPGFFVKLKWFDGDSTSTTKTVTSVGKYWVEGTDIFGYKSYDTINVRPQIFFNQLPPVAFLCSGDSLVWNTGYPANGFTFDWSNGESTPSIAIKTGGTYSVTIADNANSTCQLQSSAVVVTVDTFPDYTLGADTSFCAGNRLNFLHTDSLLSIVWSTGDTIRETAISTPGNYSVVAVNANQCVNYDTIGVLIRGIAPSIYFSNPVLCATDTIQFIDSSIPPGVPISYWQWNFGDGDTSNLQNPTHVYATPGTYTVSLTATTDSGCVNSLTKQLPAYLKPVSLFQSRVSCATAETQFYDLSSTALPALLQTWKWNFGGLDSSIVPNPTFAFPAQGKYEVTLRTSNDNGCVSIKKDSVEVFAELVADFAFNRLCLGDTVAFTDLTPSFSLVSWLWNTGDGRFFTQKNIRNKYDVAGSYPVTLQIQNAIGCVDAITKTVTVYPKPDAAIGNGLICEDQYYTPVNNSVVTEQNNTWNWNIAGNNYTGFEPQHYFGDTGTYPIKLQIVSQNGCKDSASGIVYVSPIPVANFTFVPLYGDAPLLATFTNTSQNADNYTWNFGDGVTDNTTNPTHTYTTNDTFPIQLVAINEVGCSDTITKSITVVVTDLDISVDRVYTDEAPLQDGTVLVSVYADLSNVGTRLITNARLYATIGSGGVISEEWDTIFQSGQAKQYKFEANFVVAAGSANTYVCVEATSVNHGETETRLDNNRECTSLTDVIQLIGPSPNPARGDAYLGIILPKAGKVTIEIMDILGQPVQEITELNLPVGRTDFALPVKMLRASEYFIRIKHNDDKLVRKLVVH